MSSTGTDGMTRHAVGASWRGAVEQGRANTSVSLGT